MDNTWIQGGEKLTQYINIKVPENLGKNIDEAISKYKDLGYSSRGEFVKDAVRRYLEMLKANSHQHKKRKFV